MTDVGRYGGEEFLILLGDSSSFCFGDYCGTDAGVRIAPAD